MKEFFYIDKGVEMMMDPTGVKLYSFEFVCSESRAIGVCYARSTSEAADILHNIYDKHYERYLNIKEIGDYNFFLPTTIKYIF